MSHFCHFLYIILSGAFFRDDTGKAFSSGRQGWGQNISKRDADYATHIPHDAIQEEKSRHNTCTSSPSLIASFPSSRAISGRAGILPYG